MINNYENYFEELSDNNLDINDILDMFVEYDMKLYSDYKQRMTLLGYSNVNYHINLNQVGELGAVPLRFRSRRNPVDSMEMSNRIIYKRRILE